MKLPSSPNVIVPLVLALTLALVIGWLGWSNTENGSWQRYVIMGVATIIIAAVRYIWDIPFISFHTFRLWYRIFGPSYQIEAGGEITTESEATDSELLRTGLLAVRKIYPEAIPDSPISSHSNRLDIKTNRYQTVRIDLPQIVDDEPTNDEEVAPERAVRFRVWGGGGHVNRAEALLEREIAPLLEDLSSALGPRSSAGNYWVRASMDGVNPFLRFYLKDVDEVEINHFRLDFVTNVAGEPVSTSVRKDGFRVSSRKPSAMVISARGCLSTPALTHLDSG